MTPSKKFTGGNRCRRPAKVSIWAGSATSNHCCGTSPAWRIVISAGSPETKFHEGALRQHDAGLRNCSRDRSNCWLRTRIWRSRAHFLSTSSGSAATAPFLTQGRWRRESSECRIYDDLARRGGRGSWARTIGKPLELPRGGPGPKYDVRPSAGECEPHKRINQK